MKEFRYQPIFEKTSDKTTYRKITEDFVKVEKALGRELLIVDQQALKLLSETAFDDVSHLLRSDHLQSLANILQDNCSSFQPYTSLIIFHG